MVELQGYIQLFLIWVLSTILIRAIIIKNQTKARRAPSPPALPIIGHLHLLAPSPHQAFHKLSARYGPVMQLFLGSLPCVIASTPESAKEFLKTHESFFSDRLPTSAVEYLTYDSKGFGFAPYGHFWKFMKKLCVSELLNSRTLDLLLPVRRQETLSFLRLLLKKGQRGEAVDVGSELLTLTNSIISRMTMSRTCSENDKEAEDIRQLLTDTAEISGKITVSDFIWFFKNWDLQGFMKRAQDLRERYDTLLERVMKEHEEKRRKSKEMGEGGQIRDLLDILLDIQEEDSSEIKLTRENIKAFIMEMFFAGTNTSAITTEWALAELINHPNVMEKARKEIDSVIGKGRIVEEADIIHLPYLQAIVKETLRLHPAAPLIGRLSSESCNVCGYEIPAKTLLFVNMWSIGRDPNHWEDPLEFRPERFLSEEGSGQSELDVRGHHFQLIPFGSGRRGCPGASLALQVVPATLGAMVQCFDWKIDGDNETVDMEEKSGITLPRAHPLVCVPLPRLNPLPSFMGD